MKRLALALPLILAALPAKAQVREFSCVGVERLQDDAATVTFARNADRVGSDARGVLEPLAELARGDRERNICVLGFASANEGGAQTGARLAARRARAVGLELSRMGIERDRIRAEARTRGFTRSGVDRRAGALIVLLPSP
ncbi:OmpA family protein [Roseococcus pinisoli]|uniref:OmpA family protein n=1 Tax=Roseococcus pinisoli TaxID=2835040 RepID=A0ABS5Q966_9PROT|nr:OmpA family protein [Roseococcus pinisoli]MBS7810246.1 OmpA family protein [Roseococcus pinisoli]